MTPVMATIMIAAPALPAATLATTTLGTAKRRRGIGGKWSQQARGILRGSWRRRANKRRGSSKQQAAGEG